jgi:GntR family transcriptional repressor for pyruvate dehydrogenase complex
MVASASGNPVLSALVEAITASTIAYHILCPIVGHCFDYAESAELHRKIYRAIRSHDSARAHIAMEQCIKYSHAAMTAAASEMCPDQTPQSSDRPEDGLFQPDNLVRRRVIQPLVAWRGASSTDFGPRGAATSTR